MHWDIFIFILVIYLMSAIPMPTFCTWFFCNLLCHGTNCHKNISLSLLFINIIIHTPTHTHTIWLLSPPLFFISFISPEPFPYSCLLFVCLFVFIHCGLQNLTSAVKFGWYTSEDTVCCHPRISRKRRFWEALPLSLTDYWQICSPAGPS